MAIIRKDIPLSSTSEPKAIDPVRTQLTDPDTGVTTYKHTWSNTYGRKSSSPTTKTTTPLVKRESTHVKKQSSAPIKKESSGTSSGERTFTSVARPTPAGRTDDTKPKADLPTVRTTPTKQERYKAINTPSYEKYKKPGQSFEDWDKSEKERVNKNALKNQRKGDGNEGSIDTGKNKGTSCRNC
jgi:hypothetical protein